MAAAASGVHHEKCETNNLRESLGRGELRLTPAQPVPIPSECFLFSYLAYLGCDAAQFS